MDMETGAVDVCPRGGGGGGGQWAKEHICNTSSNTK